MKVLDYKTVLLKSKLKLACTSDQSVFTTDKLWSIHVLQWCGLDTSRVFPALINFKYFHESPPVVWVQGTINDWVHQHPHPRRNLVEKCLHWNRNNHYFCIFKYCKFIDLTRGLKSNSFGIRHTEGCDWHEETHSKRHTCGHYHFQNTQIHRGLAVSMQWISSHCISWSVKTFSSLKLNKIFSKTNFLTFE